MAATVITIFISHQDLDSRGYHYEFQFHLKMK